jgi:hypothetical protein
MQNIKYLPAKNSSFSSIYVQKSDKNYLKLYVFFT